MPRTMGELMTTEGEISPCREKALREHKVLMTGERELLVQTDRYNKWFGQQVERYRKYRQENPNQPEAPPTGPTRELALKRAQWKQEPLHMKQLFETHHLLTKTGEGMKRTEDEVRGTHRRFYLAEAKILKYQEKQRERQERAGKGNNGGESEAEDNPANPFMDDAASVERQGRKTVNHGKGGDIRNRLRTKLARKRTPARGSKDGQPPETGTNQTDTQERLETILEDETMDHGTPWGITAERGLLKPFRGSSKKRGKYPSKGGGYRM